MAKVLLGHNELSATLQPFCLTSAKSSRATVLSILRRSASSTLPHPHLPQMVTRPVAPRRRTTS